MADGRSPTLIRRPSLHGRSRRTDSERSTTEQTPPRLLTCYIRLWAASTLLRVYTATGRGDPISTPIQLLIIAVVLAALFPARPVITCTALALRVAIFFAVGGPLSNSQNWAMHVDTTLLLALLPYMSSSKLTSADESQIFSIAGPITRLQLVIFYLASGVWKLNTSFMDHRYSCASIYIVSLIGHRVTANATILTILAALAPAATIAGEMLLPLLQAAPNPGRWSRLGVAATLLFHLLIGITPPPHNIAIYGVTTTARLYFWLPQSAANACNELVATSWLLPCMLAIAASVVAYVRTESGHGNPGLVGGLNVDWCCGFVACMCVLFARAISLEATREQVQGGDDGGRSTWWHASQTAPLTSYSMTILAVSYAFLLPILGLQERGGCLMFSQLRLHAGSNHALFPTALLQRWMVNGDPASALSGGVVRVERFATVGVVDWVGQGFEEILPPSTNALLRDAGVPDARYFAVPYYRGPWPIVSYPPNFQRHTLSAFGLRQLLKRARAIGRPFQISFVRLVDGGAEGDEQWRQTAKGNGVVTLSEDPRRDGGVGRCRVRGGRGLPKRRCDARERALLEEPTRHLWLVYWLMAMPNVIVEPPHEEMHCVSIS